MAEIKDDMCEHDDRWLHDNNWQCSQVFTGVYLPRYDHPIPGLPPNPIMLVLSPTRELAMQSQEVMEKAGKECEIR